MSKLNHTLAQIIEKITKSYAKFQSYSWYYWTFLAGFFVFFGTSFLISTNHFIKLVFLAAGLASGIKFLVELDKRK